MYIYIFTHMLHTYMLNKYAYTYMWHVKKDQCIWKETHKRDQCIWKENHKESACAYHTIHAYQFICVFIHMLNIHMLDKFMYIHICDMSKENSACEKWTTKEAYFVSKYVKRDLYLRSNESHKRNSQQTHKRDLLRVKICEKRPVSYLPAQISRHNTWKLKESPFFQPSTGY